MLTWKKQKHLPILILIHQNFDYEKQKFWQKIG